MSIIDLLQQKSSDLVVQNIVKRGKANWKETDISIFQFFIDIFGKEFTFTNQHYEDLEESETDLESLAIEIFNSENTDEEPEDVEIKLKEFINQLINELFFAELLTGFIASNWVTFVASVASNDNIPKTNKIRVKAHLLLIFMLKPFVKIMTIFDDSEVDISDELKIGITRSVDRIFNNICDTFEYERFSLIFAKEYSEVLFSHHEILIQHSDYLSHYRSMLLYDNRPLIALALKGIEELCNVEGVEEIMTNFLFSTENNEETLVEVIVKLINFKNLRHEVIACLKAMSKFRNEHEIIKPDNYSELFVNLFSKSKKTIAETAELIISFELNFWLEFIKMLNFYTNDDSVDIKLVLTAIQSSIETDPKSILDTIVNNINEPIISRRGAEIFNAYFEMSNEKEECIKELIDALEACKCEEITFIILLQSFNIIDHEILVSFLKDNVNYLTQTLMPLISNVFLTYDKAISVNCVVGALKKLYVIEPITILSRLRDITAEFCKVLLSLGPVQFKEREQIIPKITVLFECKSWRLVNDKMMIDLYNFCQKNCLNVKYNYFPQFQRFYINLLKHFWMLLAVNKPILLDHEKFLNETKYIHSQILRALKCPKNNIQENCLLLSSLIDLYLLFQPKLSERLKNQTFGTLTIQLSKEDFIELIDVVEKNLYPESEDSSFYQHMLMQNFVVLYTNYINPPSLTSWEVLLRYYDMKNLYKTELELLMNHAIAKKKTIFEKSVAFAILNIAAMSGIDQFRLFFTAFDDFMRKTYMEHKNRNIVYGIICSIMLEKLPRQITIDDLEDDSDRLIVLDCVTHIIKNSDQSFSKNLLKFIKINEDYLTDIEKRKLNIFKKMLSNDINAE